MAGLIGTAVGGYKFVNAAIEGEKGVRAREKLNAAYEDLDAEKRFHLVEKPVADNKACACGTILRGEKEPRDCPLFGKVCTPARPIGACMVSSEGACAAYWRYSPKR